MAFNRSTVDGHVLLSLLVVSFEDTVLEFGNLEPLVRITNDRQ
jgi:hypothetical protein